MSKPCRTSKSTRTSPERPPSKEWMVRGSLIELRRRCGKESCRCRKGEPHTSPALSYSHNGRTHILTLPADEAREVTRALKHYQQARRELEKQAMHGIEALKRRLQRKKQAARRARS